MEQKVNECPSSPSSQKQMKSRSKSTEEFQQAKRVVSSQKSLNLPGRTELEKVKESPEGSDMPSVSAEELK